MRGEDSDLLACDWSDKSVVSMTGRRSEVDDVWINSQEGLGYISREGKSEGQKVHLAGAVLEGSAGIWTRDLSHPKRESYP